MADEKVILKNRLSFTAIDSWRKTDLKNFAFMMSTKIIENSPSKEKNLVFRIVNVAKVFIFTYCLFRGLEF